MKRREQSKTKVSQGGCESVDKSTQRESTLLVLYLGAWMLILTTWGVYL